MIVANVHKFKVFLIECLHKGIMLILVFVIASVVIFTAVNLIPGDPVSLRLKNPDPTRVAAIRTELGLNKPLPHQYFYYVTSFVQGNWGKSLITGQKVREEISTYFPATIELALIALFLGVILGLGVTLSTQCFKSTLWRNTAFSLGALGLTVPIFWLGFMFIVVGSLWLGWFPSGGRFDFTLPVPQGSGFLIFDSLAAGRLDLLCVTYQYLALPVFCLSLYPAALVCNVLKTRFADPRLDTLIRALRAKGLSESRIWLIHILRLLSAPVITVIGTNFGTLLCGAVLTESVFSWPGMGRYLIEAVLNRDLFVIENGLLLIIILAFLIISTADLLAFRLNPTMKSLSD